MIGMTFYFSLIMPKFKHRHVENFLLIPQEPILQFLPFPLFQVDLSSRRSVVSTAVYFTMHILVEYAEALPFAREPCFLVRKHMVFPQLFLHLAG